MTRKERFLSVVLVCAGLLVPIGILEAAVRAGLFSSAPVRRDRPDWYYVPDGGGSRDFPHQESKDDGVFRVVVVGDSFTFGPYLQFDDTFPKRLERMLNLKEREGRVEVVNYSKPGYSSAQEVMVVRRALKTLSPDLILLEVTLNDPELQPYRVTHKMENGQSVVTHPVFSVWKGLGFVATRLRNRKSRAEYEAYYHDLFDSPLTWNGFAGALTDMKSAADESGVPIRAVVFPLFNQPLDERYRFVKEHQKIREKMKELGIPCLDLLKRYSGIPHDRLTVIPAVDSHPNEIAHRIAAEAIYTWLMRSHSVPREALPRRVKERSIYNPLLLEKGARRASEATAPAPRQRKAS